MRVDSSYWVYSAVTITSSQHIYLFLPSNKQNLLSLSSAACAVLFYNFKQNKQETKGNPLKYTDREKSHLVWRTDGGVTLNIIMCSEIWSFVFKGIKDEKLKNLILGFTLP